MPVSEEKLNEIAKQAGDNEIVRSATGMGDFSRYEIEARVRQFLRIPLDKDVPLSDEQKVRAFEREVVGHDRERMRTFERLQDIVNPYSYGLLSLQFGTKSKKPTKKQIKKWEKDLTLAVESFLELLSDDETRRFHSDAAPHLFERGHGSREERKFDINAMKRWVAKRSYGYGWTRERFESDRSRMGGYTRDRPSVERIGKKYQWLALDELLCRLADNYWMVGGYGNLPKPYSNPIDIGFKRDIDPTIIKEKESRTSASQTLCGWAFEPRIALDQVEEKRLPSWPFIKEPAKSLRKLPFRTDTDGMEWIVLYEHQPKREKYDEPIGEHGLRMEEFRFLATVLVKADDAREVAEKFKIDAKINIMNWPISDVTGAAFLHEAPWRNTWNQEKWLFDSWELPSGVGYAQMATHYAWESHLDAALPEGYSSYIPSSWLAHKLNLHADPAHDGVWRDQNGEIVFREIKSEKGGTICLLRIDKINEIMGSNCTFLTVLISERSAWPGGGNSKATWRRSEGVCWKDGHDINALTWYEDIRNG